MGISASNESSSDRQAELARRKDTILSSTNDLRLHCETFGNDTKEYNTLSAKHGNLPIVALGGHMETLAAQLLLLNKEVGENMELQFTSESLAGLDQLCSTVKVVVGTHDDIFRDLHQLRVRSKFYAEKAKLKPVEDYAKLAVFSSTFEADFKKLVNALFDEFALVFAEFLEVALKEETPKLFNALFKYINNDWEIGVGLPLLEHGNFTRAVSVERRNKIVEQIELWLLKRYIPSFSDSGLADQDDDSDSDEDNNNCASKDVVVQPGVGSVLDKYGAFIASKDARPLEDYAEWLMFAATVMLPAEDASVVSLERVMAHVVLINVTLNHCYQQYAFAAMYVDRLLARIARSSSRQIEQAGKQMKLNPFTRQITLLDTMWAATHLQVSAVPNGHASNPDGLLKAINSKVAARIVSAIPIAEWNTATSLSQTLPDIYKENRWYREDDDFLVWSTVNELLEFVEKQSLRESEKHSGYQKSRMSEVRDAGNHAKMMEIFLLWHRLSSIRKPAMCGDVIGVIIDYYYGFGRVAAPRSFFKKLKAPRKVVVEE